MYDPSFGGEFYFLVLEATLNFKETSNLTLVSFYMLLGRQTFSSMPLQGPYEDGKPDATFSFTDDDFDKVASGKMNPQFAFMRGAIKIKGSISAAQKFTPYVFSNTGLTTCVSYFESSPAI
ncbi:unnamed protein product [Fraxinus pennsylvanica]|uniref:SCP2 domain-containing protein n=1 Tax=Fraxinus pennsylvanica TaxID=56036 RepID=A0AAD2E654_9LAMI|nr:unnamed protein product [Fraxinus pennsylvanica]